MLVIAAEVVLLHDGAVFGYLHIERLVIVPRNFMSVQLLLGKIPVWAVKLPLL